jgi:predicted anti-sigma-YlaC factor YlaD
VGSYDIVDFGGTREIRHKVSMNSPAVACAVLLAMALTLHSASGDEANSNPQPLKCDIGPINKTYGKAHWLVIAVQTTVP